LLSHKSFLLGPDPRPPPLSHRRNTVHSSFWPVTADPYKHEQPLYKAICRVFTLNDKDEIINEFSIKVVHLWARI
jgi:hypothetical protein